jgi:chromate reductase, NAD(P)H dehydrogenase (quinone)
VIASQIGEHHDMTTILGLSGSLRAASLNTKLLRAAIKLAPAGTVIEEASFKDFPVYDGDLEAREFPAAVTALKERVIAADGLLLVTPEYNNGIPGAFKNAIDWLSRPPADTARVFGGKVVGLIGATPGMGGTRYAQAAWLPILRTLGTVPYFGGRIELGSAGKVFDESGAITDPKIAELLAKFVTGFAKFVVEQSGPRG